MGVAELRNMPHEAIAKAAHDVSPVGKVMKTVIPEPVTKDRTPEFSVITCSVNDQKFHGVSECYKVAFAGEDYEIVRVSDAKGLAEGYRRGAAAARGRILVFSHDDAAPLRPIGSRLRAHLRQVDIVAGAGTDRLDGPAWFTAGPPHVFGQVLNKVPGKQEMMLTVYGVPAALVPGIVAFDGFWFACDRSVLDRVNFDPDTCPGFHMYDVDFSYRAWMNGLKIGVATDLSLCHASTGGYGDPQWKPLADRWMAKWGGGLRQHKPHQFQFMGVTGSDPNDMIAVMDEFVERTR